MTSISYKAGQKISHKKGTQHLIERQQIDMMDEDERYAPAVYNQDFLKACTRIDLCLFAARRGERRGAEGIPIDLERSVLLAREVWVFSGTHRRRNALPPLRSPANRKRSGR